MAGSSPAGKELLETKDATNSAAVWSVSEGVTGRDLAFRPLGSDGAGFGRFVIAFLPNGGELSDEQLGVCLGFASRCKAEHRRVAQLRSLIHLPPIASGTIHVFYYSDARGRGIWHDRTMRQSPSRFQPGRIRCNSGASAEDRRTRRQNRRPREGVAGHTPWRSCGLVILARRRLAVLLLFDSVHVTL